MAVDLALRFKEGGLMRTGAPCSWFSQIGSAFFAPHRSPPLVNMERPAGALSRAEVTALLKKISTDGNDEVSFEESGASAPVLSHTIPNTM